MAGAVTLGGDHDLAARLLGAAAAARRSAGLPPAPAERDEVSRITAAARAALGEDTFTAAFDRGGGLRPEEARSLVTTVHSGESALLSTLDGRRL